MDIQFIHKKLSEMVGIYIHEFTFNNLRIDAIIIDIPHRWIRGFEIKMNKADFNRDFKWQLYTEFCSSLSIVCPSGIIEPKEVNHPFGLLWIHEASTANQWTTYEWKKRPKKFNRRDSLAWTWTYLKVLEKELPRLACEK